MAKIKITKNGPYIVSGKLPMQEENPVYGEEGYPEKWQKGKEYPAVEQYALCRCGRSENKPYCDGSHSHGFECTETADDIPYDEKAEKTDGPELVLSDAREFCVGASFCDRAGGTWQLTQESDDPKSKKIAIEEACNCPSGRLVMHDKKTGLAIEPEFEPSISFIEDPNQEISGPIWVKGGVPIESAEGKEYEKRNRVTLCRCGKSSNKPFCDGTHKRIEFKSTN